jgi:hypothetical protein
MPRGYRRKRRRNYRGLLKIAGIVVVVMALAIAWVWKSNQVKEYYAKAKRLETDKTNMVAENTQLRAALMDLKSISHIDDIATKEFGLTQNVSERHFLPDPVSKEKIDLKLNFASEDKIPDWLEDAVVGSGRVRAETQKKNDKQALDK